MLKKTKAKEPSKDFYDFMNEYFIYQKSNKKDKNSLSRAIIILAKNNIIRLFDIDAYYQQFYAIISGPTVREYLEINEFETEIEMFLEEI